ncbi:hypothetical protein JMJ55_19650 [Belnapia sp. T6]|uniref:Uncharacterized protein n=1 Tax=Belnapia mucosa TaxID=2804532 RepID=A0ABS1V876_9PROT|nr:hypothetical protein [Belnapia mucosa]MBL6457552.1 hypothetical protein [Belnapia mucosa]
MDRDWQAEARRAAAARQRFQDMAVRSVPMPKMVEQAKRLGLHVDRELAQLDEGELAYAFDLAIYTAPPGRSRAIDRIARQHARLRGEAVLVLNALTRSWLSVFRVLGPHPDAGLVLEDALLGGEVWVLDEVLAEHEAPGTILGARLGRVLGYAITSGVAVALDEMTLAGLKGTITRGEVEAEAVLADPRFAQTLWQRAMGFSLAGGSML